MIKWRGLSWQRTKTQRISVKFESDANENAIKKNNNNLVKKKMQNVSKKKINFIKKNIKLQ